MAKAKDHPMNIGHKYYLKQTPSCLAEVESAFGATLEIFDHTGKSYGFARPNEKGEYVSSNIILKNTISSAHISDSICVIAQNPEQESVNPDDAIALNPSPDYFLKETPLSKVNSLIEGTPLIEVFDSEYKSCGLAKYKSDYYVFNNIILIPSMGAGMHTYTPATVYKSILLNLGAIIDDYTETVGKHKPQYTRLDDNVIVQDVATLDIDSPVEIIGAIIE